MKLITTFKFLIQNFRHMDLIREVMISMILATERLHEDYRKYVKKLPIAYDYLMEFLTNLWDNKFTIVIGIGVAIILLMRIYMSLPNSY